MRLTHALLVFTCAVALLGCALPVYGWSNGGYSAQPSTPDYGTHDWIAQHALDYLPADEKKFYSDNLAAFLYGTELPDRPATQGGYGDTTKHHVYVSEEGAVTDDASARRAQTMFDTALRDLRSGDTEAAAHAAGAMTHYIDDLAVFGHVMGDSTPWGVEVHHQDYENHVLEDTDTYQSSYVSYLHFDGNLTVISAEDASKNLAVNTTFGGASGHGCVWMDQHYDWSSAAFKDRCGESLNLAVNTVADVLHTLCVGAQTEWATAAPSASAAPTPTATAPEFPASAVFVVMAAVLAAAGVYRKKAAATLG